MGWNKNVTLTICITAHTHTNIYTGTNTDNRKSVSEWEGVGRLAGAVLVEDMASVHLSISKHSQLSSLSTGGEVISFFFSPLHRRSFLISASVIYLLPTSHFISLLLSFFLPAFFCFSFSTPPFSSPSPPSSAPCRLLCSQWNSPFSNKTKLPTASHTG